MYNYAALMSTGVMSLEGKTLVELGCGRGGGLDYLVKNLRPAKAFGIDLSDENINFCKKTFKN